jgi:hypothetical protein
VNHPAHPMDRTANWCSHGGLVHSGLGQVPSFWGLENGRFWIRVIKTEPEPGLIFGTGFGLGVEASFFFKELEPKPELGSESFNNQN